MAAALCTLSLTFAGCDDASKAEGGSAYTPGIPKADGPKPGGRGDTYRAKAGPLLASPATTPEKNRTLLALLRNIEHTPRGATIRIVGFSFSLFEVAEPLIAAAERGVKVRLVLDSHSAEFKATQALVRALGRDRHADSFVVLVKGSARGSAGHLHQKTWSFTRTGRSKRVVMVGSMNPTRYGTVDQYADMYAFVGRHDVWRTFTSVFRQQVRDQPVADLPRTERLGDDTAYFFPGYSLDNDPIQQLIAEINPVGATIRVGTYAWHNERGLRLAAQLADLARAGARVEVLTGLYVGTPVETTLRSAGAIVRSGVFPGDQNIHLKMLLVDDPANGRRYVTTGSDNWSDASYDKDDLVMAIALSEREFRQYAAYYERIMRRSARQS